MSDDELFRAAQRGDVGTARRCLEQLLQEGAPPDVFRLALNVAIWNDHGEIVREIVRRVGRRLVHELDTWERYLFLSARRDSATVAGVLIQCKRGLSRHAPDFDTILHLALHNGSAATAAVLIPHVTGFGRTLALTIAAHFGQGRVVRALIRCGVGVNRSDYFQQTALHCAAQCARTQVVKQLLWFKAEIQARNAWGQTPLDVATTAGHVATAGVLRRFAAKENEETTA